MSDAPDLHYEHDDTTSGKGLAVTSLVLGIVALLFALLFPPLGIVVGGVGLILGVIGLRSAGRGYAVGGIVSSGVALLLGVTILGLFLLYFVMGARVGPVVVQQTHQARVQRARVDMQAMANAADMVFIQIGSYPESIEGLVRPIDRNGEPLAGGLDEYPIDPWGNEYDYELREGRPVITCFGRDGRPGGEGPDEDFRHADSDPVSSQTGSPEMENSEAEKPDVEPEPGP